MCAHRPAFLCYSDELNADLIRTLSLVRQHTKRIREIEQLKQIDVTFERRHSERSVDLFAGLMTTIPPTFFRPDHDAQKSFRHLFRFAWVCADSTADAQAHERTDVQVMTEGVDTSSIGPLIVEAGNLSLIRRRPLEALKYYEFAAMRLNHPEGFGRAAWLLVDTDWHLKGCSRTRGYELAERGAALNDPLLGECYRLSGCFGIRHNEDRARELFERSAYLGCEQALACLWIFQRDTSLLTKAQLGTSDPLALSIYARHLRKHDPARALALHLTSAELCRGAPRSSRSCLTASSASPSSPSASLSDTPTRARPPLPNPNHVDHCPLGRRTLSSFCVSISLTLRSMIMLQCP